MVFGDPNIGAVLFEEAEFDDAPNENPDEGDEVELIVEPKENKLVVPPVVLELTELAIKVLEEKVVPELNILEVVEDPNRELPEVNGDGAEVDEPN